MEADERKRKSGVDPGGEIRKGSTCGTAVGAKQGRTKGNKQRSEYENQERMHEKSGRKEWGKPRKGNLRRGTGAATVRQKREERKGRNRGLSSRKQNRSNRKSVEGKRKIRKAKAGSKHLRNSCGSESGKGERKHTAKLSTGTGKECTGNQAGKNGENRRSESESGALRKPL